MALGALISAYQEDDAGSLRALLPLAGRTLVEYQVRCASAAGAAPVIVLVERVPQALQDAFERLRSEGVGVFPASDVHEAASRFEAGSPILILGDGIAPPATLVAQIADEDEATVATVPDDEAHEAFERIDGQSRWAGVMAIDSDLLRSTAQMLGDWDLQSTLLRRSVQEGALRVPVSADSEPVLADRPDQLALFQKGLFAASKADRDDAVARMILPPLEDLCGPADAGRVGLVPEGLDVGRARLAAALDPARPYRGKTILDPLKAASRQAFRPHVAVAARRTCLAGAGLG